MAAGSIAPVQHVRLLNLSLVSSNSAIKLEANTQTDRLDVGEIRDVFGDTHRGHEPRDRHLAAPAAARSRRGDAQLR